MANLSLFHRAPVMLATTLIMCLVPISASAGEVDVLGVNLKETQPGIYRFYVTVQHGDEGWEHYVNKWEVTGPDGVVYGTRKLLHPHVREQPFARSLSGVAIPEGVTQVTVRAHDSVHGWGDSAVTLNLPARRGKPE